MNQQQALPLDYPPQLEWRSVVGFPNYMVCDAGWVRSLRSRRILRPWPNGSGYDTVTVYRDRRPYRRTVHQLVLEAFGPPRPTPLHECDHRDGRKNHNAASNLRWLTKGQNIAHAFELGQLNHRGELNPSARLTADQVREIVRLYADGETLKELARTYGVRSETIRRIVRGMTWREISAEVKTTGGGYENVIAFPTS